MISVPEFLDLHKTDLEARADLAALDPAPTVYTHWPTLDFSVTDSIILGFEARSAREPSAVGRNRLDEEVALDCQVRILRAGAGETKAKAARDRARSILISIDNELRTNPPDLASADDQVLWSRIGRDEWAQFPDDAADPTVPLRVCVVTFEINYRARVGLT